MKSFNFVDLLFWLKEHDALDAYFENTKNARGFDISGQDHLAGLVEMGIPAVMLLNTFIWKGTPEGQDYWEKLEDSLLREVLGEDYKEKMKKASGEKSEEEE